MHRNIQQGSFDLEYPFLRRYPLFTAYYSLVTAALRAGQAAQRNV